MGERCRAGLRLGRAMLSANKVKPAQVPRPKAAGLAAGEAQVEAEGEKEDDPAQEPMTAGTL